jgi:CDP-diacylglycerol--glycerol-3-phosphate 3-phosphatidyltransferase
MTKLSWPNRITITRILLIAPFVVCLLHLQDPLYAPWPRYAALAIFALMAISDGLDGYLARRLQQRTRLGAFLDPMADKLLITCAMVMLGYAGTSVVGKKIPDIVVVAAIAKDLLVIVGFMIIFFMSGQALVRPRLSGKACTAVQLLTVLSVLLWPDLPPWLTYLPDTLWWLSLVLAVVAALDYVREGGQFLNSQGTIRQA